MMKSISNKRLGRRKVLSWLCNLFSIVSFCYGFGLEPPVLLSRPTRHVFRKQQHFPIMMMKHRNIFNRLLLLRMVDDRNIDLVVRDWKEKDYSEIQSLLSSSMDGLLFDPEGIIDVDCGSAEALNESYNPEDGGCFLVATTKGGKSILGTAGLIVGTQIQYLKSGASVSSGTVTGAIRRVVCDCNSLSLTDGKDEGQRKAIIGALVAELESRAIDNQATELIVLAYPEVPTSTGRMTTRPTAKLLQSLDYKPLPVNMAGVDVEQYCKQLINPLSISKGKIPSNNISTVNSGNLDSSSESSASTGAALFFSSILITVLLIAMLGVANLLGLEISPTGNSDNNGIGTPLSSQELIRLQRDEELKRTDLDAGLHDERQWKDLSTEEVLEETALMKIIQGQNVRIQ